MKSPGRFFFIKENIRINSNNEFKRALLTGYLSFISIAIGIFYMVYNYLLVLVVRETLPIYFFLSISGFLSWWLNRNGKHFVASIILLVTGNVVVFIFSARTNFETDTHLFYLVICLAAYALFGYENRKTAFLFSVLSITGFIVSFSTQFSILPPTHLSADYIRADQIITFLFVTLTTSIILYVLVKVNYQSEAALKEKQQEIKLQNQSLTKANAELDQFVYSASHDLRSPLSSILGLVNIAKRSENSREILRCLDMIHGRVHRLDDFIKDIVDFSRNSRIGFNKYPVNVHRTVSEILEDFDISELDKAIDIKVDIPTDLLIDTDPARLKIVLSNLIGNSIKHHDKRNKDPFVSIHADPCNNGLNAITVSDNGPGIDPEYQGRIFDMFYRASDHAEGSGLGLYIAKETIAKLEGSIQLQSTLGKGSSFTVTLPA